MKKRRIYIATINRNKKYKLSDSKKYEDKAILIKINDDIYIDFKRINNSLDFLIYYLYGILFADPNLNSQFNKQYISEKSMSNYFKEEEFNEKISVRKLKKTIKNDPRLKIKR